MGAFLAVFLVTRLLRKVVGTDVRGSAIAFVLGSAICIGLASFGFSSDTVGPLQVLPWVALGYGKFAVACFIVDLDTAKRIAKDPNYSSTLGRLGFKVTPAWLPAGLVIVAGGAASFAAPSPLDSASAVSSEEPAHQTAPPSPQGDEWTLLKADDIFASVMMPGVATRASQTVPNPTGRPPMTTIYYEAATPRASFAVLFMKVDDAHIDPSATIERVIEGTRDSMLKKSGATVQTERWFEYQGWPALEVNSTMIDAGQPVHIRSRIILQGRRSYVLIAASAPESDSTRFLQSLLLSPPEDDFRLPHRRARPN